MQCKWQVFKLPLSRINKISQRIVIKFNVELTQILSCVPIYKQTQTAITAPHNYMTSDNGLRKRSKNRKVSHNYSKYFKKKSYNSLSLRARANNYQVTGQVIHCESLSHQSIILISTYIYHKQKKISLGTRNFDHFFINFNHQTY